MAGTSKGAPSLEEMLQACAETVTDPAGREIRVIREKEIEALCSQQGQTWAEIHVAALRQNILPYRYLRNRDSVTTAMQLKLAQSRVAVIGAGGLGGQVILLLARMGVGSLVVVDGDVFDETNENRQALSSVHNRGVNKAIAARSAVASINPGVEVFAHTVRFDKRNGKSILRGCHVVVDALDSVPDRFAVEAVSRELEIPFVHGAVAGFEGQVMSIFPEDPGLELLYGKEGAGWQPEKRPEAVFGVPAVVPCLVATLQVTETMKILLNKGRLLRNRMLRVDLETAEFHEIVFTEEV